MARLVTGPEAYLEQALREGLEIGVITRDGRYLVGRVEQLVRASGPLRITLDGNRVLTIDEIEAVECPADKQRAKESELIARVLIRRRRGRQR